MHNWEEQLKKREIRKTKSLGIKNASKEQAKTVYRNGEREEGGSTGWAVRRHTDE